MVKLFDQHKIRNTIIKNRIAVPPMVPYHWSDQRGMVSQKHIEHYEAIASGGAGLIIQEGTCVNKNGRLTDSQLGIWEDAQIEGLRRITEAAHRHNTPILVQIHHAGIAGIEEHPVCPSDYEVVIRDQLKTGHELSIEDLHALQQDFIAAAVRAVQAGYDGIEIHACHSYLISQFHNRNVNKRKDQYGDHPELFASEIIQSIRRQTPDEFIIGIRLGGFEPSLQEAIDFARIYETLGVDFIDVSYGFAQESLPTVPDDYPFKDIIYAAQEIKKTVNLPVFAVNSINSPTLAESILEHTNVDMVHIGRGTLVNYNWAKDAHVGYDVGSCLYCKTCMWRVDSSKCPGRIRHHKLHRS